MQRILERVQGASQDRAVQSNYRQVAKDAVLSAVQPLHDAVKHLFGLRLHSAPDQCGGHDYVGRGKWEWEQRFGDDGLLYVSARLAFYGAIGICNTYIHYRGGQAVYCVWGRQQQREIEMGLDAVKDWWESEIETFLFP